MKSKILGTLILVFSTILVFTHTSCEPAVKPAYIKIDTIILDSTDYVKFGATSNAIDYVWLVIDDNYQGTYQLPAVIPVIGEGPKKLEIYGGVREFSTSAASTNFATRYINYLPQEIYTNLVSEQITQLNPHIQYDSSNSLVMARNLDFATDVNSFDLIDPAGDHSKDLVPANNGSFGGTYCMKLSLLNSSERSLKVIGGDFNIPTNREAYYMELDFKGNAPISFFLINPVNNKEIFLGGFTASAQWRHVYLNMVDEIGFLQGSNVKLKIEVSKGNNLPTNEEVFVDNIKFFYY